jgi:hypothetical protein
LAELRIDGVQKEIVDLYSPKIEWQSCITVCCLANGKHMGTVRVLGRNSSHSSGRFVDLDAFVVQ